MTYERLTALDRLTESLRVELRGSGIVVTLMRPGTTRTVIPPQRIGRDESTLDS